jgi:hypothetical protein
MNRCTNPTASTISRWLAATDRLYSTSAIPPQDFDGARILTLLSRWKPATTLRPHTLQHTTAPLPTLIAGEKSRPPLTAPCEPLPEVHHSVQYKPLLATPHGEPAAVTAGENLSPPAIYKRPLLPLSPLMDPDTIAAKGKYTTRKARPSKSPELSQQMLAKNPYARALATPLRRCVLTYNAWPSFFLLDFNLMAHPETGSPWYVPRSLANNKRPTISEEKLDVELELEKKAESTNQSRQIIAESTPALGYSLYTIASQHALRAMQDPKGYGRKRIKSKNRRGILLLADGPPARFVPDRYRQSKTASKFLSTARWRSDMHEFVLNLMRRRIMEALVRVMNRKRGYVVGCSGWEDALAKPQVGAFLWTGGAGELYEGLNTPPEFATLDVRTGRNEESKTRKIPVHNLRRLLGKERLAELQEKSPSGIFEREIVVLRRKTHVVELEMQLWRLQGYLAEYRELYRDLEECPMQGLEGENEADDDDEDNIEEESKP